MALADRRDDMTSEELVEELELRFPETISKFEHDHPDAWEALVDGDPDACDPEELEDLLDSIRALLRI
jgi:hypothetical protein